MGGAVFSRKINVGIMLVASQMWGYAAFLGAFRITKMSRLDYR
jgi:hypothetical protein